ncbi:hypothetical protein IAR55_005060 [Kwoniella newhampshirensis]|uniref:Alpha-1,3-mannosyltransferase CMT1 n=1 Tax=Kwoniella newhampshirensis TaxID=1651941 RepID=A0AAW0YX60_9TREE
MSRILPSSPFRSIRSRPHSPILPSSSNRPSRDPPLRQTLISRSPLVFSLCVALLFLVSLFSNPDPTQRTFQFPSLLPSSPISPHVSDPSLSSLINTTYASFLSSCPNHEPVHLDPSLTHSQKKRYNSLRSPDRGRYMFVTNTRQIADSLPDLLNALIVLTKYLSPNKIYLSILEGPSSDCTSSIITSVLVPTLRSLGIPSSQLRINTDEPKIDWSDHNRIEKIADLRNRALSPLWDKDGGWGRDTEAIVFFNDVYIYAGDVLELLFQHVRNGAGITTGMDWWKKRPEYYYDIWVGRTIDTGDLFYPIDWTWWSPSSDLFPNSPITKKRYDSLQSFQVYSSWNAMAVLAPEPFLPPHNIRFRRGNKDKGECAAAECLLIAADFWKIGRGKVQVVPSVQFAYERDVAQDIIEDLSAQKQALGWIDNVPPAHEETMMEWTSKPPERVRCHPWPEVNGLSANVWEETRWVKPWLD